MSTYFDTQFLHKLYNYQMQKSTDKFDKKGIKFVTSTHTNVNRKDTQMSTDITNMLRERVIEEKTRRNLSTKTMADTSRLHLPEETIRRFLSGKTADPGVTTFVDIVETVGLKPYEVFMDSATAAKFRAFLEIDNNGNECEVQRIKLAADNEELQKTNAGLADRLRVLEMELEHKEELLALHNHYNKIKPKK